MKALLIGFIIVFNVHAQRGRQPQAQTTAISPSNPGVITAVSTLANPVEPIVACAEPSPPPPAGSSSLAPQCQDLFSSVCSVRRTSDQLKARSQKIYGETYATLPADASQAQRNQMADLAIRKADESYDNNSSGGLSRDDVRRLMDPARWNVISLFNGVGTNPSPAAQRQMTTTVQNIHLVSGSEYVASLVQYGRQQNPGASADTLRRNALTTYTAACGQTGMEINAFYEDGNVILCPGLAYSMRDYGAVNGVEEMKAAMMFTMSHEITHSIGFRQSPGNYANLMACYQTQSPDATVYNSPQMKSELTSDYYGAFALGKYLRDNNTILNMTAPGSPGNIETVIRILARSVGSYCTEVPGDTDHPSGRFRINQVIAKTPAIMAALGCPAPTNEKPSCTLRGPAPPNPIR